MNDVQRELHTIIDQLDDHELLQLLREARELQRSSRISGNEFLDYGEQSLAALHEKYGKDVLFNSLDVLNELREERDDELG